MKDQLNATESEQDLVKVRDEVFRKIGRNLLNFQNIEQQLKNIIICSRTSGYISELDKNLKQKTAEIHSLTMGVLVKQFLENTYLETNHSAKIDAEISEPYFSISLGFNTDEVFIKNKIQSLKSLVDERNDLVHHLLPKINLHSIESCLEMDKYLDAQRERLVAEREQLGSLLKNISETWGEFKEFCDSEEGLKAIELCSLQSNTVITALCDLSTRLSRHDGWTLLDRAGRELHSALPDEMANLKKKYGYKTLKEIMLACELFELNTEPTQKGGTRALYRLKPEFTDTYH
jgi:hypothetical protein